MNRSSFIKSLIGLPFVAPLLGHPIVPKNTYDGTRFNRYIEDESGLWPQHPVECTGCSGKGLHHYVNCPRNGTIVSHSRIKQKDIDDMLKNMLR